MEIRDTYKKEFVPYLMDAGDGRFASSEMPAPVAAEIASKAGGIEDSGNADYPIRAGRYLFPDVFEGAAPKKKERPRRGKSEIRPTGQGAEGGKDA